MSDVHVVRLAYDPEAHICENASSLTSPSTPNRVLQHPVSIGDSSDGAAPPHTLCVTLVACYTGATEDMRA